MSDLRAPLKTIAEAPLNEVAVQRMWRGIGKRRARRQGGSSEWALRAVVALAACVAVTLALVRFAGPRDASPLRLAGGAELASLEGAPANAADGAGASLRVELEDGSHLVLGAGARMKTLENGSSSIVTLLEAGRVTFDVRPGGPRRWTIECGLATVEVVGTRFTIERSAHHGRIEVEHGIVLVRGELVKDRIQRLTAGETLDIDDAAADASAVPAPIAPAPMAPAPIALSASARPASTAVAAGSSSSARADEDRERWRELAQKGAFKEAYSAVAPFGVAEEARKASVGDLLLLADVARLSGHSGEAVAPLERILAEHGGDARAPMAAFTLGRVELDALGKPAPAAQAFARAIAMGLPQGLREDAYARVVEARARAGDREGARSAAAEYEARYPSGSRLAKVRAWADGE